MEGWTPGSPISIFFRNPLRVVLWILASLIFNDSAGRSSFSEAANVDEYPS